MKRASLALIICGSAAALAAMPSAAVAEAVPVYSESAGDALARNVRTLADDPKNFQALVAAGKAALDLGDAQAAAGFFGRAQDLNSNSPLPSEGMGAALAETGDPNGALTYFTRAQQLGASVTSLGCDRGLAYDLLGRQTAAQTDYRAALNGPDRNEARRRLALSLAIGGKKALAMSTLQPLLQNRDLPTQRTLALVLALSGDIVGAKAALDSTMPGASVRMDPFFRRLPSLSTVQKAAAVHLGIFPEGGMTVASAQTPDQEGDRLASIEQMLSQPPQQAAQLPPQQQAYMPVLAPAVAPVQAPPVTVASAPRSAVVKASSPNNELIQTKRVAAEPGARKIWLQLASDGDASALPDQFRRLRSREPKLFSGISGYIADSEARSRLLIGPFHSREDAQMFADALSSVRINASSFTSDADQVVRKLSNQ